MSGAPGTWNAAKTEAFSSAFYQFLNHVRINSKDTGADYILGSGLYLAQKRVLEAVWNGLREDKHDIKVLKGRQAGISTLTRAFCVFWLGFHRGMNGAMVFDSEGHTTGARQEVEDMIDNLPKFLGFPTITNRNRYGIRLANQSRLMFMSAGTRQTQSSGVLGRSSGINLLWACMAPGTPVLVEDGRVKAIEEVRIGDRVLTHTGAEARVVANVGQPNRRGFMRRIVPWLGQGVLCTKDHKIPTNRGLLPAGEITEQHLLMMPLRRITNEIDRIQLPQTPARAQGGGSVSAGSGAIVQLNEEFGFAVGYYLAEGCMRYQRRGARYKESPAGIIFSRHRNETGYADRAIAALAPFTTGSRLTKDIPNCLTTIDGIYGAALASWIREWFGADDNKRIPDAIFRWGEDFCRGLVIGLLCGDGSKTPCAKQDGSFANRVNLVTTRGSIAFQARDLVAALGWGWSSARYRQAGVYYGRNCKASWTMDWAGYAAAELRHRMGLPVYPTDDKLQKYQICNGHVYIKIYRIDDGIEVPVMYDLSVDHPDHTFRTPHFAVSNSEMCSWINQGGVQALKNALSTRFDDRMFFWESTARGPNVWKEMWDEARADDLNQIAVFIGWWANDALRIEQDDRRFVYYGAEPPNTEERARITEVHKLYDYEVTQEQLAWYRYYIDPSREREAGDPSDSYKLEDQPWTEFEAFQLTGSSFFNGSTLLRHQTKAVAHRFKSFKWMPASDDGGFFRSKIEPAFTARETDLRIWEEPLPNAWYVVACDPAFGHSEKSDHSAIEMLRCYADCIEQVAEFQSTSTPTHQLAWMVMALEAYYGSFSGNVVHRIIEINGPGEAVWREIDQTIRIIRTGYLAQAAREAGLADFGTNCRNYVYTRSDSMTAGHALQFKTTQQLKVAVMERLRDFIHNDGILIRSREVLEEMVGVTRDGDKIGAEGQNRDDRTIALALGVRCWEERVRRTLVGLGMTRERDHARRSVKSPADRLALMSQFMLQDMLTRKRSAVLMTERQMRLAQSRMRMRDRQTVRQVGSPNAPWRTRI